MKPNRNLVASPALVLVLVAACQDAGSVLAPDAMSHSEVTAEGQCVVTTLDDNAPLDPAIPGSIRDRIADSGCNEITFAVSGTIALTAGQLIIDRPLMIAGPTDAEVVLHAGPYARVFHLTADADAEILRLSLVGGSLDGIFNGGSLALLQVDVSNVTSGRGITNVGTLAVSNSSISNNRGGSGSGIYNDAAGSLTVVESRISDNSAMAAGGGIFNLGGMTLNGVTVTENSSTGSGGGIVNATRAEPAAVGEMTLTNSTVSGNVSNQSGGGIFNTGMAALNDVGVNDNSAAGIVGTGGGITNFGMIELNGSTVTGNTAVAAAGLRNAGSSARMNVNHSTVSGNVASDRIGGIENDASELNLYRSVVADNDGERVAGGIISRNGTMTIDHSRIAGNTAGVGGGIISERSATVILDSEIDGNEADDGPGGGVLATISGSLVIERSTIVGNTASTFAGGIVVNMSDADAVNELRVINSTVSANVAGTAVGGLFVGGNNVYPVVSHSTFTKNSALTGTGGGIVSRNLTLRNSIVAGNTDGSGAADLNSSLVEASYTLIGSAGLHTVADGVSGNIVGADPLLGTLADNGGATRTHALLAGSPAIEVGVCTDPAASEISTDQRGMARPQGTQCDIGAFEREQGSVPVFGGFLSPVSGLGWNQIQAGQTVPIRFSLGGDFGLDIFASGYPRYVEIDCVSEEVTGQPIAITDGNEVGLTYSPESDQYHLAWRSDRSLADSCVQVQLKFEGTTQAPTAKFRLRRGRS
jgi:hypothetical protein